MLSHPVVSFPSVAVSLLFAAAYSLTINLKKGISNFVCTDIWQYNKNKFTYTDFASSTITNCK